MTTYCINLALFMAFLGIMAILFPEEGETVNKLAVLIPIGCFFVFLGLMILFSIIFYKNVYYAYTNKRVIIRSGIFGVDYKSINLR